MDENEAYFADLKSQGFPDEDIATERRAVQDKLQGRYVWPENWLIAQVFENCEWERASTGMAGSVLAGISSVEINATCIQLHIPPPDWPDVLRGVRTMTSAALAVIRERAAKR